MRHDHQITPHIQDLRPEQTERNRQMDDPHQPRARDGIGNRGRTGRRPTRRRRIIVTAAAGTALAAMLGATPAFADDDPDQPAGRRVIAAIPGLEVSLVIPATNRHASRLNGHGDRYYGEEDDDDAGRLSRPFDRFDGDDDD